MATPHAHIGRYTTILYANDQEVELYADTRQDLARLVADDFLLRAEQDTNDRLTTYAVRDFINETIDSGECLDISRMLLMDSTWILQHPDGGLKVMGDMASISWVLELAMQQETVGYIMPTRFHRPLED
jgi:hypothetical protein